MNAPSDKAAFPWSQRLLEAHRHDRSCDLCEHHCLVNRAAGERGDCKAGVQARVFRHRVECGEEVELIPSHLFYLSGCDLRCAFCIAEANAFDPNRGRPLETAWFREAVAWGQAHGARNLQWVGGEPTIHLPAVLDVMSQVDDLPPIVWKSDFYGTTDVFSLLDGVVDVYVADFKFGNDECARRIASVERYVEVVTRNLLLAARQTDLIVRHLLLPGHFDCCYRRIVDWMRRHLPWAKFSLRDGYLPRWQAPHFTELNTTVTAQHVRDAARLAESSGLNLIV